MTNWFNVNYLRLSSISLVFFACTTQSLPTQTFHVSATVVNGCVVSGTNKGFLGTLNFGEYPSITVGNVFTDYVQSPTLKLACTPGTTLNININGGSHYSTIRNLKLVGRNNVIGYQIFTRSNHSAASEIEVNQKIALDYSRADNIILPLYGLLKLNGVSPAGKYVDMLTVTLSW